MAARKRTVQSFGRVTVHSLDLPMEPRSPATMKLAHDALPGFVFAMTLAPNGEVRAFNIECARESPGLTAVALREVPLGELRGAATAAVATRLARMMRTTGQPVPAAVAALERAQRDRTERTIAEWTRRYTRTESRDNERKYAKAASAYVERLGERRPVQALAKHLIVSVPHARNLIYEARKRGLLTEAQPGRAGGTLTPKAMDLLKQGD